jgi:nitroreductase
MKSYFSALDDNAKDKWAKEQVYLALWNVMNTLAQKWIDSCAIWWFNPKKYDELLGLWDKWLESVIVLPIWYRNENDKYSQKPKVRFEKDKVIEIIK